LGGGDRRRIDILQGRKRPKTRKITF